MKITTCSIVAAFFLLGPIHESAAKTQMGTPDCGEWLNKGEFKNVFNMWLLGFISGANWASDSKKDLLKDISNFQAYVWVDNYCRKNPLKNLGQAAAALVLELEGN